MSKDKKQIQMLRVIQQREKVALMTELLKVFNDSKINPTEDNLDKFNKLLDLVLDKYEWFEDIFNTGDLEVLEVCNFSERNYKRAMEDDDYLNYLKEKKLNSKDKANARRRELSKEKALKEGREYKSRTSKEYELIELNYIKEQLINLDKQFNLDIENIKKYILDNYVKSYPTKLSHKEAVEILIEACNKLGIYEYTSASFLTLMFEVKYNEGIFNIIGEYDSGVGYQVKGKIGKARLN